ncbi:hypothetical protein IM774_12730 [Erysipelotrichaceae bacterium RD49]|nr:hypothetical protein [Erysipelotrichaceae bacterium RD49]
MRVLKKRSRNFIRRQIGLSQLQVLLNNTETLRQSLQQRKELWIGRNVPGLSWKDSLNLVFSPFASAPKSFFDSETILTTLTIHFLQQKNGNRNGTIKETRRTSLSEQAKKNTPIQWSN